MPRALSQDKNMRFKPWDQMTGDERVIAKEVKRAKLIPSYTDPELLSANAFFRSERKRKEKIAKHVNRIMELRHA